MSTECCEPARETQVQTSIAILGEEMKELEYAISGTIERLTPVIRQPDPSEKDKSNPEELLVPVAHSIRQITNRVRQARLEVNDAVSRLEI